MTAVLDVTVVICTYTTDRWHLLGEAVASVRAQTPAPAEILVVVDHDDATLRRACTLEGVRAVASTGPRGLSGARNTGVAEAATSLVAFLDDDAVAAPGWLAALCAPLLDGSADVVGGAVEADWALGRPAWFAPEYDWVVGCTYVGWPTEVTEIRNPIGCSMAFTREALVAAGPFRTGIGRTPTDPSGCEETELCIRLRQRWPAVRILSAPSARASQLVPGDRTTLRYFVRRCTAEGRSKARVAGAVGRADALASESDYVSVTLPRGIGRELREAFATRRISPLARATTMVLGVAVAAIGFVAERAAVRREHVR